jgi:hypothetical protein
MGMLHPENSLVVSRNMWLILLSKIVLYLNLVKQHQNFPKNYKDSKYVPIFL